jgi:hypothetical protein
MGARPKSRNFFSSLALILGQGQALVHFSLEKAKALSQAIATRIESLQGLFLLVDHRFHLKNIVPLKGIPLQLQKM